MVMNAVVDTIDWVLHEFTEVVVRPNPRRKKIIENIPNGFPESVAEPDPALVLATHQITCALDGPVLIPVAKATIIGLPVQS